MLEKYKFRIDDILFKTYNEAVEFKQNCEINDLECEIKHFDGEKMLLDLTTFNFDKAGDRYFIEGVEEEIIDYGSVELKDILGRPKSFSVNNY